MDKNKLPTAQSVTGQRNTFYQFGRQCDPRTLLQTDYVKVHMGGGGAVDSSAIVKSYKEVNRDVMADLGVAQDGGQYYTSGKYDGVEHGDVIIRKQDGSVWQFGLLPGLPYILPEKKWNAYLAQVALKALRAGAIGVTLQEIGVFGDTGYEQAFRDEWKAFYGKEWSDQLWDDANLYFMGQHLRNYLSTEQIRQIFSTVKEQFPDAPCILANHTSVAYYGFMNACGNHDMAMLDVVDGIEAQTWSNTMEIAFGYEGQKAAHPFINGFFDYSYWANLGKQSQKPVYYITDPKGDGYTEVGKTLEECHSLYRHQLVSQLAFASVYRYNCVVWPDRSYNFGYDGGPLSTDGYRRIMNNIVSVQTQMEAYQEPVKTPNRAIKVGALVLDTACYQAGGPDGGADTDDQYGMFAGLMFHGLMVDAIPFGTGASKTEILEEYDLVIASYDTMKPVNDYCNERLHAYVENGGVLLFMGGKGTYEDMADSWWKKEGFVSPQDALISRLGITVSGRTKGIHGQMQAVSPLAQKMGAIAAGAAAMIGYDTVEGAQPLYEAGGKITAFEKEIGKGCFIYLGIDPVAFCEKGMGDVQFHMVKTLAAEKLSTAIESSHAISYYRGPYLGYHALADGCETEKGLYINMFDEDLPVVESLKVKKGESALLMDIREKAMSTRPVVLFAQGNHPTVAEFEDVTRVVTSGPEETQGAVRVFVPAGYTVATVSAVDGMGKDILMKQAFDETSRTLFIVYQNNIEKCIVDVTYQQ